MTRRIRVAVTAATSMCLMLSQFASAQISLKRGEKPATDRPILYEEVAQAIAEIEAQAAGSTLLVECNGVFGYSTIQSAIDAAEDGDVVVVLPRNAFGFECDGDAYVENINFLGKAITVQSLIPTNSDYVETTIVDGSSATEEDQEGSVVTFNHSEGAQSILDGLTLTKGIGFNTYPMPDDPPPYRYGGGIFCGSSSPTIRNCTISDNQVFSTSVIAGGGICCRLNSSPLIVRCKIINNIADPSNINDGGGGIACKAGGHPTIQDCLISGNIAKSGGGVLFSNSSPTIQNCTIAYNTSTYSGGGITTVGLSSYFPSDVTINNCVIIGNAAEYNGGGIISGNIEGRTLNVYNSLIAGNYANKGGGFHWSGTGTIRNCTFSRNTAWSTGGGVYVNPWSTTLTISNSILWGDIAPSAPELYLEAGTPALPATLTVEYSDLQGGPEAVIVEDDYGGAGAFLHWSCGNIDLDPGFIDPDSGDFHLTLLSLARNAGDPDFVPEDGEMDIDGDPRVQEGRVDMGADEFVLEEDMLIEAKLKATEKRPVHTENLIR